MATDRPAAVQIAANRERQRALYGAPLGDRVHRLTGLLGITQARLAATLGVSPAMLSQLVSARRIKIGDPAVLARLMLLDKRCPPAADPPGSAAVDALLAEVRTAQLHWAVPTRSHILPIAGAARPGAGPVERNDQSRVQPFGPDGGSPRQRGQGVVPARPGPGPHRTPGRRRSHDAGVAAHPVGSAHHGRPRPPAGALPGPRSAADALRAVAGPSQLVAAAATLDRAFPELAELLRQAAGRPVAR
ncbi:hypothetical protein [Pseudonocardia sp. H11422]|uniref:hypothetical protein n=1 Tax=Pseudonocardia sp. H11422 TaxID=2835866 RepID=UPI001BDCB02F|nr:hypothetical protein [Pseudonocardia sp. H11422]